MKLPNKQILIAHAAHGLRRQNADACSRAKFGVMLQRRVVRARCR